MLYKLQFVIAGRGIRWLRRQIADMSANLSAWIVGCIGF